LFARILNHSLDCFQDTISTNWGCEELNANENILTNTEVNTENTIYCAMLDTHLVISADGLVQPCCFDYNLQVFDGPIGNVNRESLVDVWNGDSLRKLREIMKKRGIIGKPKKCLQCPLMYPQVSFIDNYGPIMKRDVTMISPSGYTYKILPNSFIKKIFYFVEKIMRTSL
jgi:radical SAM protein with 4Fe4S-binding SPASM domain